MDSIQNDNSGNANRKFIPGSLLFDLKTEFSKPGAPYPHTAPTYAHFCQKIRCLGIETDTTVILYDAKGVYSSPRGWWLFKLMGHENVLILDGGLPQWIAENRQLDSAPAQPRHKSMWEGCYMSHLIADKFEITAVSNTTEISIVDARSHDRYLGITPEPREGLCRGHIPNSVNVPFKEVLENGRFKSPQALKALFKKRKLSLNNTVYFTCGSGVTACIVLMAAIESGLESVTLYDASWTEWGANIKPCKNRCN